MIVSVGFLSKGARDMVVFHQGHSAIAEIVSDPSVMSGEPVVRGTRILADTIVSYLRADCPPEDIFRDYPSLPVNGIEAVARWAEMTYGPGWKSIATPAL